MVSAVLERQFFEYSVHLPSNKTKSYRILKTTIVPVKLPSTRELLFFRESLSIQFQTKQKRSRLYLEIEALSNWETQNLPRTATQPTYSHMLDQGQQTPPYGGYPRHCL